MKKSRADPKDLHANLQDSADQRRGRLTLDKVCRYGRCPITGHPHQTTSRLPNYDSKTENTQIAVKVKIIEEVYGHVTLDLPGA